MSKKINVKAVRFIAEYTAIKRNATGAELVNGSAEVDGKGKRDIKRHIAELENCNAADVIISKVDKQVNVTTYKVAATSAQIIDACARAGLPVEIVEDAE